MQLQLVWRSWWVQAGGGSADDLPVAAHPHAVPHLVPQRVLVPGCRPVTRRLDGVTWLNPIIR